MWVIYCCWTIHSSFLVNRWWRSDVTDRSPYIYYTTFYLSPRSTHKESTFARRLKSLYIPWCAYSVRTSRVCSSFGPLLERGNDPTDTSTFSCVGQRVLNRRHDTQSICSHETIIYKQTTRSRKEHMQVYKTLVSPSRKIACTKGQNKRATKAARGGLLLTRANGRRAQ